MFKEETFTTVGPPGRFRRHSTVVPQFPNCIRTRTRSENTGGISQSLRKSGVDPCPDGLSALSTLRHRFPLQIPPETSVVTPTRKEVLGETQVGTKKTKVSDSLGHLPRSYGDLDQYPRHHRRRVTTVGPRFALGLLRRIVRRRHRLHRTHGGASDSSRHSTLALLTPGRTRRGVHG